MKVLVTGASKGIGEGIATFLGRNGHQLGLLARSEDLLKQVQERVRNEGGEAEIQKCDLRDPDNVHKSIENLIDRMSGVDALINNAGLVIRKDAFEISLEEWRAMMETNVHGLFYATRTVLPYMKEQGSGHIINVSSISGHTPLAGGSGYAASKYAVTGFSESLFLEIRNHGIKVTTIFPGSVDSKSHRHDPAEDTEWKVQPEEVGEACHHILTTRQFNLISKLEIRPLRKPS
ncbi:MAG: SDR family NAD(P)-dependent oxidoreductase [Candidatus Omnitrophica bacterium]|nr:SDR family NAD(P)-dependent oxidoreductase [Candidatus Omnitrophota bacterium]